MTPRYLTPEEVEIAKWRLAEEIGHTEDGEKLHWKAVKKGALDWRT